MAFYAILAEDNIEPRSVPLEISRVDVLLITVGTRQIGWRCQDGVICCMGTDGDRGTPRHVDRLYQELGIERGYHEANQPWSVRDLGQRYYEHCQNTLGGDFSQIELLLDDKIITDSVAKGLKHIILWATEQPDNVSWAYRRLDTLWLAKLIVGKIKSTWSDIKVDVLHPVIDTKDVLVIRQQLETDILPVVLEGMPSNSREQFVLAIENKGGVPNINQTVDIRAVAFKPPCYPFKVIPIEPQPLYEPTEDGFLSACLAQEYQITALSDHFWTWELLQPKNQPRGSFAERLWPDYTKDWFSLSSITVPHDWSSCRSEQQQNDCRDSLYKYLKELLLIEPPSHWLDNQQIPFLLEDLKYLVGNCSAVQGDGTRFLTLGNVVLLLAAATSENAGRWLEKIIWRKSNIRSQIMPEQTPEQASLAILVLAEKLFPHIAVHDATGEPLIDDVSLTQTCLEITLNCDLSVSTKTGRRSFLEKVETFAEPDGQLYSGYREFLIASGKSKTGREARCVINLKIANGKTIMEFRPCKT